ncbi:hypothetical protein E2C01_085636 [Portunus trituberculatus]|uniref:Uncharacterized protein n=1 Tax=Portunus trituberculatus TaxID=210409 RepID=A0A5B7J798_PORTR|nr:hypothetical protein [Portunus trituberculatus]
MNNATVSLKYSIDLILCLQDRGCKETNIRSFGTEREEWQLHRIQGTEEGEQPLDAGEAAAASKDTAARNFFA